MNVRIWIVVLLSAGAFAGGLTKKKKVVETPTALQQYVTESFGANNSPEAAHAPGSIWSPNARFANLGQDLKAKCVNDLVTIVVNEKASAVATGDVKTQRTSSAQSSITSAAGISKAAGPLANLLKANTNTQLQGQGTTSRGTVLTATLSARVVAVLPNGYLVVEGVKHVQVNSENQVLTVRGVIRPTDLDPTNSVPSDRVAQMEILVNGKGVVGDSVRRPFILYRILLGLLPF